MVLRREPNECSVMLAWQAHMNIQLALNAYACVMYVASYIMKPEISMRKCVATVEKHWFSISNPQRVECTSGCV